MSNEQSEETSQTENNVRNGSSTEPDVKTFAQKELDAFVENKHSDALEYLKLLKEELSKTDKSRTRHTYISWLLVGMFLLLDANLAQLHFEIFEKIDQAALLKLLPAAIMGSYYVMMSRVFVQSERVGMFHELADRLFPGKNFPFSYFIKPTHFILSERLLNIYRPHELFTNVIMLGLIVEMTTHGPAIVGIYAYIVTLSRYGIHDGLVQLSVISGLILFIQAIVILRGLHVVWHKDKKNE